jgi:hypothetical protein
MEPLWRTSFAIAQRLPGSHNKTQETTQPLHLEHFDFLIRWIAFQHV